MELTSRLTLKERLEARQVVVAVADGVILERVRRVVGPGIPVIATLDLHANVSQRMVDAARADEAARASAQPPVPPPGVQWSPDPRANPSLIERWRRLYPYLGVPIAGMVASDEDARQH